MPLIVVRYVAAGIAVSATDEGENIARLIGGIYPFPFPRVANLSSASYESRMRSMNAKSLQHHTVRSIDDEELLAIIKQGNKPYPHQLTMGFAKNRHH